MHPRWAAPFTSSQSNVYFPLWNVEYTLIPRSAALCVAPRANSSAIHLSSRLASPAPHRSRCSGGFTHGLLDSSNANEGVPVPNGTGPPRHPPPTPTPSHEKGSRFSCRTWPPRPGRGCGPYRLPGMGRWPHRCRLLVDGHSGLPDDCGARGTRRDGHPQPQDGVARCRAGSARERRCVPTPDNRRDGVVHPIAGQGAMRGGGDTRSPGDHPANTSTRTEPFPG